MPQQLHHSFKNLIKESVKIYRQTSRH